MLVLILMVVAGALIVTTTLFLVNMLDLNITRINQTKALEAAAAGVFAAVVDYENNTSIAEVSNVSLGDNIYYSIGGSGMFFLADCSSPRIIADRKLKDVTMTNVNSADAVTITHLQVSWTPDSGENLIAIDLGRGTVEWSGSVPSGTNVDMTDYTIGAGVTENDVWLDWETGSHISSMAITGILTFSDGSTVEITFLNSGSAGNNALVITSTGKVTSNDTWLRTIKAGYDVGTGEIVSWQESSEHL